MESVSYYLLPQVICKIALLAAIKECFVAMIENILVAVSSMSCCVFMPLPQPQSTRDYTAQDLAGSAAQCERRRQQHGFFKGLPEQPLRIRVFQTRPAPHCALFLGNSFLKVVTKLFDERCFNHHILTLF